MKKFLPLILILVALVAYFFFNSSKDNGQTSPDADLIFFWGEGCPHCENVKKYIAENNLDSKIKISSKEVYSNQSNQ